MLKIVFPPVEGSRPSSCERSIRKGKHVENEKPPTKEEQLRDPRNPRWRYVPLPMTPEEIASQAKMIDAFNARKLASDSQRDQQETLWTAHDSYHRNGERRSWCIWCAEAEASNG